MTKSSRAMSVMHCQEEVPPKRAGYVCNTWTRKAIAGCILFAFINLDVLYPMQQAMAAERRSELEAAVRNAHVDAQGDMLVLADQVARRNQQQPAQDGTTLAGQGNADGGNEHAPVVSPQTVKGATTAGLAASTTSGNPATPAMLGSPAASQLDSGAPSALESGTAGGNTVEQTSTAMPATLVAGVGAPFDLMGGRKPVLFGADGPSVLLAKTDGGAQARSKAGAATAAKKSATPGTSSALSDYVPQGGTAGGNGVNPSTGKLEFSVPLASLPGFSLSLDYSNTLVKGMAETWNYDAPTGDAGLGWGMPAARMRIMRAPSKTGVAWNDRFLFDTGSEVLPLTLVQTGPDGVTYYRVGSGSLLRIERHAPSYWIITDAAGQKYYFGDSYRSSDNTANETTTSEYQAVCTALKAWMTAASSPADSCAFGAVDTAVRWGTWQGPMSAAGTSGNNVVTFPTAWNLSAIEAFNGKRTTLFYLQHMQPVNSSSGPTFTKSSYLYKVEDDNDNQLIVGWQSKQVREVPDPRTEQAEPDAYQEKMQVLYLASTATSVNGTPVAATTLNYALLNDDDINYMGKRIPTGVTPAIYDQSAKSYVALPGWQYSYWGQSSDDGVSVGRWNASQAHNAGNGAQFGMLKTAIGPGGATASYAYAEQTTIASKSLTVSAGDLGITTNRHVRFGPNYALVGGDATVSGKKVHRVALYAWTSTGWSKALTQDSSAYFSGTDEAKQPVGWDITAQSVQWASAGDGMVAVLLPNATDKNSVSTIGGVCSDLYLFYRDADNPDAWHSKKLNSSSIDICGWAGVAAGNNMVALATTGPLLDGTYSRPSWSLWSSADWSYMGDIQSDAAGINEIYTAKYYADNFSNAINGTLASASAQIGEGFIAFYLTGKDNSGKGSSLQTSQTYTTEFLFVDEGGLQGTYGMPTKVVKTNEVTVNSFDGTIYNNKPAILPQYLTLGQARGESPNVRMTINWDQQIATGSYCMSSDKVYCLLPLNGNSLLGTTNQRAFFTQPNGWQSPIDTDSTNPGQYIKLVDNSGLLMETKEVGTATTKPGTVSNSAQLSNDVMELSAQALVAGVGTLQYLAKQDCNVALVGPSGYADGYTLNPSTCFANDSSYPSMEAYAGGMLEADIDWAIANPNGSGSGKVIHILHDPAGNGIKTVESGISTYSMPTPYNSPVEQNGDGEETGIVDAPSAAVPVSSALIGALIGFGNSMGSGQASTLGLVASVGLGIASNYLLGGGQSGSDFLTEQVGARPGTLGSRVFYVGNQAEIRNPDDSFTLIDLYDGSAWTQPAGTANAYLPLTFSSGNTVTIKQAGFKNGDVRRTANAASADPAWEQVYVSTYSSSSVTPWVTEQSTATSGGTQNTHNDVDRLTSDWAFVAYKSVNYANFRDAASDFTLYAMVNGTATGGVTDTVAGKVVTSDGTRPTLQTYTYYNDANKSGTARVGPDNGGIYGRTEIALSGVQAVNIFVTDPLKQKGCIITSNSSQVVITEVDDNDCFNGADQSINYEWLPQPDGRLESLAYPGQCLQASTTASTGFTLTACDPSQALQIFAGALNKEMIATGLTTAAGKTQCLAVDVIDDSDDGTAEWYDSDSGCSPVTFPVVSARAGAAGKLVVYSYSGGGNVGPTVASQPAAGGYLQYNGPGDAGALPNNTLVNATWNQYQSSLLGRPYKTELYRQGTSTPYHSTTTNYQIAFTFPNSNSVATQPLNRSVSVAGATSTTDGVTVSESYDYNALGQLRAVHQATQQMTTSVASDGTIGNTMQTRRQSSYVYYAWETPDYAAAMLKNNQYAPVYLSYAAQGVGSTPPAATGASAVTYAAVTNVNGTSFMLPQTTYTARGNSISMLNQVRFGFNSISRDESGFYMEQFSWACMEYASNNRLYFNATCGSPAAPTVDNGSSLYNLTRLADLDNQASYGDQVLQKAWMISPSTSPGYCLQASAGTSAFATGVACDTTDTKQVFYIQERFFPNYGYITELRSLGLNQCMYGIAVTGGNAALAGWTSCLDTAEIPGNLPVGATLVSITPASPVLMRGLDPATSQWKCLQAGSADSATISTADCTSAPSVTQQFLVHAANGVLELADGSGRCLYNDTFNGENYLDQCTDLGNYGGDQFILAALALTPALANTATQGLSALQAAYTGNWPDNATQIVGATCLSSSGTYTSCSDSTVMGFSPRPVGTPAGMVAVSALADTNQWIPSGQVLARDTATLIPTATIAYLGVDTDTNQLMGANASILLSKDGRGLPVSSFGLARADQNEAAYAGFESYEYSGSFSCGGMNGWTCSGGALTTLAHAGAAAYGGTGATTVTYANVEQADDYTGTALSYIASAWVKPASGKTCSLGFNTKKGMIGTTSSTGDGVNWFYVEVVAANTATLDSASLQVSCPSGGTIDDVRFNPLNGSFAAVVYDTTRQYQPIASLGDGSMVTRSVLNEFGLPYIVYVERVSSNQQVGAHLTGGFSLGGASRLQGFGVPNGSTATQPMYTPATPNTVAAIGLAPETALVCDSSRMVNGCANFTSSNGYAIQGKSFVLRARFAYTGSASSSGTATIAYSYGTLYAPTLTFNWASASSDATRPNGSFTLADQSGATLVQTGIVQWPRDLVMVAIRDAVLLFGDGKLLLSHEGSNGYVFDDFTSSSTVKMSGMSMTKGLIAGTPSVAIGYANATGQTLQAHSLQTTGGPSSASLIDVAAATLYDGWGGAAVQTLSMYYTPGKTYRDSIAPATRLLAYRPSLVKQFNWTDVKLIAGDLVDFYQTGGGAGLITSTNDPYYAFSSFQNNPEPSARTKSSNGAGWALSAAATQLRTTSFDYQDWAKAGLATDASISTSEQSTLRTASTTKNTGASLQAYKQGISDVTGSTGMRRRSWIDTSQGETTPGATEEIWSAVNRTYFSQPAMSNTGIATSVAAEVQQLLPNYFQAASTSVSAARKKAAGPGAAANTSFVKTSGSVDLLGQWTYATGPNVTGATHVFSDDLGRIRFYRANPSTAGSGSQGFRYVLYDQVGRISETGILINTDYGSNLSAYATRARNANLDQTLANRCPIVTYTYDVDPRDGSIAAYSNWLGRLSKVRNYTTPVADAPTSCSSHDNDGAYNEIWYQYDDLGRLTATSETRHTAGATASVFRATAITRSNGNRVSTLTYPDTDQTGAANAFVTGSSQVTYVPDVMGRLVAVCDGNDCFNSDQVYYQVMASDWRGLVTSSIKGNGNIVTNNSYDLRGALTGTKVYKSSDTTNPLFNEQLRYLQTTAGENPCPGDPSTSPNWSGGKLIGRQLDGSALPSADQGVWNCYTYDGAGRQIATTSSKKVAGSWQATSSYSYSYDPNGNLTGYTRSTATSTSAKTPSAAKKSKVKKSAPPAAKAKTAPVKRLHNKPAGDNGQSTRGVSSKKKDLASGNSTSASYLRSGSDRITVASLPDIGDVTPGYNTTYGYVTALTGSAQTSDGNAYALNNDYDPYSGKQLSQTLVQTSGSGVKSILFNRNDTYDAVNRRIDSSVDGGQMSAATGSTGYWYGPMMLKPLWIGRQFDEGDGDVNVEFGRVILLGDEVLAMETGLSTLDPHYLISDHLGSTRVVLDGSGNSSYSFGYDDWGKTTISGQASAGDMSELGTLFRFQGIEQESFPLTALGVDSSEALAWLDGVGLYHYYGRHYAAGLAAFLAMDPARASVSPYSAFASNPANFVDPDGMITREAFLRQQLKRALLQFAMEMFWTGLAVVFMHIPAGAGLEIQNDASLVTAIAWPISRLVVRTIVHAAFTAGGLFISRNAITGWEMVLQGITESLQAYLFMRSLGNLDPTNYVQNTGRFYGSVLATETLMQGILVGIEYFQLRRLAQGRNYDFESTSLAVTFHAIQDLGAAAPAIRDQLRMRIRQSFSSGMFYLLVYFSARYLADTFTAGDTHSADTRRWNRFTGFFFVLRNFIGYYQLSAAEIKAWRLRQRKNEYVQRIQRIQRIHGAIPLPAPPVTSLLPTNTSQLTLTNSGLTNSELPLPYRRQSSVRIQIASDHNMPSGAQEEEKIDEGNEANPEEAVVIPLRDQRLLELFNDPNYFSNPDNVGH